jgi:hypothetical protein
MNLYTLTERAPEENPCTYTKSKPKAVCAHFPITLSFKFITPADRFSPKATWIHHRTGGFEWFFLCASFSALSWKTPPCTLCPDIFSAARVLLPTGQPERERGKTETHTRRQFRRQIFRNKPEFTARNNESREIRVSSGSRSSPKNFAHDERGERTHDMPGAFPKECTRLSFQTLAQFYVLLKA